LGIKISQLTLSPICDFCSEETKANEEEERGKKEEERTGFVEM